LETGHQAAIDLIQRTVAETISSFGLAGFAADVAAEVAIAFSRGVKLPINTAAQIVLNCRLKPIQDLFQVAAPGTVVITILKNYWFWRWCG
jgi:hypothetical protein